MELAFALRVCSTCLSLAFGFPEFLRFFGFIVECVLGDIFGGHSRVLVFYVLQVQIDS